MMNSFDLEYIYNNISNLDDFEIFKQNEDNTLYSTYLEHINKYFKESKGTLNTKFNYYVNEHGDYVKEAIDTKDDKNNIIIKKPHYININNSLNDLNYAIKMYETQLRIYRNKHLENDNTTKYKFNELLEKYEALITEKKILNEYNTKYNTINNTEINEIKMSNIQLNIEQSKLLNLIKMNKTENNLVELNTNYTDYISNNDIIIQNIHKIKTLNLIQTNEYVIKKLFDNKKVKSKKFKLKKGGGDEYSEGSIFGSIKTENNDSSLDLINLCENSSLSNVMKPVEFDLGTKPIKLDGLDLGAEPIKLDGFDLGAEPIKLDGFDLGAEPIKLDGLDLGAEPIKLDGLDLGAEPIKLDGFDLGAEPIKLDGLDDGLESVDLSSLGEFETVDLVKGDDEQSSIVFKNKISEEEKRDDKSIGLNLDGNCTIKAIDIKSIPEKSTNIDEPINSEIDLTKLCGGAIKKNIEKNLDIKSLSRKLNKIVKDPNIKYITVNPNLDFSKVSKNK